MPNKKRKTLAKGIYEDASGRFIRISVKGKPVDLRRERDQRADDGTLIKRGESYKDKDKPWLRDERKRRQAEYIEVAKRRERNEDTFSEDVKRFLNTIGSKGHRINTQGYMSHWETHFKDHQRNAITDIDAQTAFAAMTHADATKIHIRRALIQFYETLNGKSGYNPGRSLTKPRKPEDPVRDLPWEDIEAIFDAMRPSRAKARLMLMAYIGLPQKQIAALHPSHLRLDRRELIVHPRRKGAGVGGRVQPLSDYGVAALKLFQKVDAFGSFQTLQLVRAFKSAAERAEVVLPAGARPYDLRHSFLTELARGGADIRDIAELGMHATLEQAGRYIKGAAAERATKAITSVPRFSTTTKRKNLPKRSSLVLRKQAAKRPGKAKKRAKKR